MNTLIIIAIISVSILLFFVFVGLQKRDAPPPTDSQYDEISSHIVNNQGEKEQDNKIEKIKKKAKTQNGFGQKLLDSEIIEKYPEASEHILESKELIEEKKQVEARINQRSEEEAGA